MSGIIDFLNDNAGLFVGPFVVSMIAQSFQLGFLVDHSITFWSRAKNEKPIIKIMVAFVSLIAVFQTSLSFYSVWRMCVVHHADWWTMLSMPWSDKLTNMITIWMACPVQAYLIWRCWMLTNKSLFTLLPLSGLLLGYIAISIDFTDTIFHYDYAIPPPPPGESPMANFSVPIIPSYVMSLMFPAILDVCVTTILLIFLLRAQSSIYTREFRRVVRRLIIISWEAALPPCACALVTVVLYMLECQYSYWSFFAQGVLGKLYVVSLFVTLNGRARLRPTEQDGFIVPDQGLQPVPGAHLPLPREHPTLPGASLPVVVVVSEKSNLEERYVHPGYPEDGSGTSWSS
ncbi:hypothetical protein JAAARDRAFT_73318 [Jaapia argillacea MUCL 33604]|uniref:DUF6534 domain-containing protein n=1 Tax=Jaapia argillacea MUCL 33604 TaxID=933084 RepID=A0A067PDY2_9AGAM|nr:hypothetical protein JAAARDRAFT_73318 [Jaapia argillacea MUCL 33604]